MSGQANAGKARPLPHHEPIITEEQQAELPAVYSITECVGTCMEPIIQDGAKLWFDATQPIQAGDVAAIWWKPGQHAPGSFQLQIKHIVEPSDGETFVYGTIRRWQAFRGQADAVMAIHKCMGFRRPDGTLRSVDFRHFVQHVRWVHTMKANGFAFVHRPFPGGKGLDNFALRRNPDIDNTGEYIAELAILAKRHVRTATVAMTGRAL